MKSSKKSLEKLKISKDNLVAMIDHTLLKPNSIRKDVEHLCEEAVMHQFGAVCVKPCDVRYVAKMLQGTNVNICTVVGFPWGIQAIETKAIESKELIYMGANEIDMVINRSYLKDKNYDMLKLEINDVVTNCKNSIYSHGEIIVKTILETAELTDEEIIKACQIAKEAGADYVKTSTGASPKGGATVKAVKLMHKTAPHLGIKAAGGIKDFDTAYKMIKAGATRIGTSSGVAILAGYMSICADSD